jgi:hypothetical protein
MVASMALAQHAARLQERSYLHPSRSRTTGLTFVTTTDASSGQKSSLFKPTFTWEMLNLNVDPTQTIQTGGTALPTQGCTLR